MERFGKKIEKGEPKQTDDNVNNLFDVAFNKSFDTDDDKNAESVIERTTESGAKTTLIYGRHPVVEAIKAGQAFEKIYFQLGVRGEMEVEMRRLTQKAGIPMSVVPLEKLNSMTRNANHQGVVGMASLVAYQSLADVLPKLFASEKTPLLVMLDGITDVRNFGAIARSAEVLGANAIIVAQQNAAPLNAEAIKASAGALMRLPVCREKSLNGALDVLGAAGVRVLASDLKAKKMLEDCDFVSPVAIVMGAEDVGVSKHVLQYADECFLIPQSGHTDSLNVSVATGIVLYEALRQRLKK